MKRKTSFLLKSVSSLPIETVQLYSKKKKEILNSFHDKKGLYYLELYWDYNGEVIKTLSITSKNDHGIIYDDILSNLLFTEIDSSAATKHWVNQSNYRISGCDYDDCDNGDCDYDDCDREEEDGPVSYRFQSPTYRSRSWLGKVAAEARCYIEVEGFRSGSLVEIDSYNHKGYFRSDPGFSADAKVVVTHFEDGEGGLCEYTYGVMTGSQPGLSLSFDGFSISIPSGGHGEVGGGAVNTRHLH